MWKTDRRYSDFIDGRANTLFDAKLLNDYLLAYNAQPRWASVLARRHVGTVVVDSSSPLATVLRTDTGWQRRHGARQAVIYSRGQ